MKLPTFFLLSLLATVPSLVLADDPPVGYTTVRDEGTNVTRRRRLNFTGTGVSVADDAVNGETDVTISGGASSNSFETINVPAGTDPAAESATDILNITETTFLTFTGDSATDTIDVSQVTTDLGTDGLIAANAVALTTDTTGNYVEDVTAGAGLTKSSSASEAQTVDLAIGAGTYIDINADDVAVDATEILDVTFAAGANATQTWTINLSGTDPQLIYESGLVVIGGDFEIRDASGNAHLELDSSAGDDHEIYNDGTSGLVFANKDDKITFMSWNANYNLSFRSGGVQYYFPTTDGSDTQVLTTNGRGGLSWSSAAGGSGDITAVGNCTTGAAFTGSCGNSITPSGGTQTIVGDLDIAPSSGNSSVTLSPSGADQVEFFGSTGNLGGLTNKTDKINYLTWSALHALQLGSQSVPTINLTTDGTGDGEIRLPHQSIGSFEIVGGLGRCATVENLASGDDNMPLGSFMLGITVTAVWCHCYGTCTTPATIQLEDDAGNAMTGTATCDTGGGSAVTQAISAGGGVNAYEGIRFDVTNTPSPETDEYAVCLSY